MRRCFDGDTGSYIPVCDSAAVMRGRLWGLLLSKPPGFCSAG